jgi:hypothetical protein
MEPMETANHLLYFAEPGDGHLHLVRPVTDGDRLAIGNEPDELETVEGLKAFPPGYVAQLTEPLKGMWPDGTPVGIVIH